MDNQPKKPRSKTLLLSIIVVLVVIAVGLYYILALAGTAAAP